ncbi:YdcF family protein [Streptomyces sp. RB17]|uniref:YdcF family protein n=1 Tax=Streptomyces sp. RB17 TaxID=2585197 RepID=UPI002B21DE59|nr:YdcF family protein [Streptomyces sp. RB17]
MPKHQQRQITDKQFHDAALIWDYHQMGTDRAAARRRSDWAATIWAWPPRQPTSTASASSLSWCSAAATAPPPARASRAARPSTTASTLLSLGVPGEAILVEPNAASTGQNITLSREVLAEAGVQVESLLLISKPYMERRSYATCRKLWPEVHIVCASEPLELDDYIKSIGDEKLVVDMLVGDLQRVIEYPKLGFAVEQEGPRDVCDAYKRLLRVGFDSRLINS